MANGRRLAAWYEGKKAFYVGNFNNPYILETIAWREWNHGFDVAYLDNQQRLSRRAKR